MIIGASSGIGRATAIQCSRLGASLTICGRNETALEDSIAHLEGTGHSYFATDLSNPSNISALAEKIQPLNGMVFCAGKGLSLPFSFSTKEKFDDIFSINLFSPIELTRSLLRKKKLVHGASIVFVSSVGGNTVFSNGASVYGISKAALTAAMKYCAKEFAPKKIRVNCVNPGMTNTRFIHRGEITEEQLAADEKKYPLQRYGEPEDIAYGIVYLLSDASSWVTGHALVIDGGISI